MTMFQQFDISDFFDQMSEPLFMIDSEEIIFFNAHFKSNFKFLEEDWKKFVQYPNVIIEIEEYFKGKELEPFTFFKSLQSKSSEYVLFEWSFVPLPSSYQDRFLILKGVRSKFYTESMLLNPQPRTIESESYNLRYLESILNNTHDLISILDVEGNYKFVGPNVGKKLGFKVEDIVGRNFRQFIDAGIIELVKGNFESVLNSEEEINIDFWVHKEGQEKIYIESYAKNLQNHPHIKGILFSGRDITDYVQMDISLQKRLDLENIINKISHHLINENLKDLYKNFTEALTILSISLKANCSKVLLRNLENKKFEILTEWQNLNEEVNLTFDVNDLDGMVEDQPSSPNFGKVKLIKSLNKKSVLLIPMISTLQLKGVLVIEFKNEDIFSDESELQILRQLGDILYGAYQGGQMLQKIERNENLLATTELLAKSGSWRYSPNRNSFHFSGGLARMFGLGDKPTYAKISTLIYNIQKEDRNSFINNIRLTIETRKPTSGEFRMLSPGNRDVILSYEIDARDHFFNHSVEVFGFCTDITQKKASEEYLLLQSQILTQVNDPIVVTGLDLNLIYVNEAAKKLCGSPDNEPLKGSIYKYFEFYDPEESLENFISVQGDSSVWKKEIFIKISGKEKEPFELSLQPIFSEKKEKIGFSFVLRNLSEKYEAEKLANRAKMIVENSPTILFRVDPNNDFQIVYISENINRFGYNSKELIDKKKSILDLLYPEDARRIREKAYSTKTSKGIKSFSGSYRLKKSDGQYIWVEDQTREVLDETGEIYLHEGILQDINDRKNLEVINEQRDRQYRLLASNIPGTNIFLLDKERKYIVAEGTNFDHWGITREDFEGKFLWEIFLTSYEEVNSLLDRVYYEREIIESEFPIKGRYYSRTFRPIIINEQVEFVLSIIRDITDEHQAKIDLIQSEEKYRTLVEESTEIIFSLTETFVLRYVSPNVYQYLGYKTEEVIGRSIFDFLNPDDMGEFQKMLDSTENFLAQNQFLEFRLLHKNGEYKVFNSNGKLILDKDGKSKYYTGIARDISRLKEAQGELLKAKENAEQASLIKSQFLSIMSHEIRTPMNAVIGLSHLLVEGNPRPDQLENLKTLQFSAENLMALINDILDFTKIDSGKVELELVPFDLQNVISRIVHSHSFQASEKLIKVEFKIDPKIPNQVIGDPIRLGQIINNLISNAIKFTENGYVKIILKEQLRESDYTVIEFTIEDTGIGIPEDKIETIFEAFTQASTSTTRKYGGTGLGLAIVKRLVALFGGEISVSSIEGKGSQFRFFAKFKIDESAISRSKNLTINGVKSLQNASILVAEDNYVNQILIQKFLNKWNVGNLVIASNGEQALEEFEKGNFNLVLLDLQMPVLDGFSTAKAIRSHSDKEKREVPILALTATSLHEVKNEMMEIGFNDFIPKPFIPDILYEKLIKQLNRKDYPGISV
ncbi:PAS domain S-box protein [Algoriphagus sp.]|uniref:PAS domain S-box protein n=1 Tax=Algoriphagus sp. TaxID=1872435 RepID=UPI0025F07C55|nr:PAS domain S-box protein [Algoriphagus sp.]